MCRSTFELARSYGEVIGIDLSQTFIDMANKMKDEGQVAYSLKVEGDITQPAVAQLDRSIDAARCTFLQVCWPHVYSPTACLHSDRLSKGGQMSGGLGRLALLTGWLVNCYESHGTFRMHLSLRPTPVGCDSLVAQATRRLSAWLACVVFTHNFVLLFAAYLLCPPG